MISFPDIHTSDSVDIWGGLKGFREFCDGDGVPDGLARPPESLGSNSQTLTPAG